MDGLEERMRNKRKLVELIEKLGAQRSEESGNAANAIAFKSGETENHERGHEGGSEEGSRNDTNSTPAMHDGQESDSAEQGGSLAEQQGGSGDANEYERAAFMLGSAMLDRIGIPEGIHPIAVVVTLLERMDNEEAYGGISDAGNDRDEENAASMGAEHASGRDAVLPRPMRGSMGQAPETDYYGMSSEDFRNLREKIKRASRDGRRIRI